jgi:CBS domain containing-hemolysin-like protein
MLEWLLIIIIILLSGFFSGTEIAYVSANRLKLEIRARKNTMGARHLSYFLRNPDAFLSTTLIGNNIINVLYATLMTLFLTQPIIDVYQYISASIPSEVTILVIQTTITSIIIMIFGEVLPKTMFRTYPDFLVAILSPPLRFLSYVFSPLVYVANNASAFLIGLIQKESPNVEEFFKRSDIELIFREIGGDNNGDLDKDDSEILTNVLELQNIRVKDSMIPRTEIVAVEMGSSVKEALDLFISSGFSKLPVYEENLDNIVGVVIAYDLFKEPKLLNNIIRPIKHVPSSQRSKTLLAEFQKQNVSMAVVIDEYGGTAGLVTIEDLIEEVVGDIQDEYDEEENFIKPLDENTWLISGSYEIEDLLDEYSQIQLPMDEDSDFETLAGYIIHHCGRIPKLNEEIVIGHYKFIITKSTRTRIEVVKLIIID